MSITTRVRRGAAPLLVSAVILVLSACTSVPQDAGFGSVEADTRGLLGAGPAWPRTPQAQAEVDRQVEMLLAEQLSPDSAMRIALLNSPRIRARLESLGMARADFLNAVLPPNPLLSAARLEPDDGGSATLSLGISLPLLGLLLLPQRARVGEAEFQAAKAEVATEIVKLALETRTAYVEYVATRQIGDFYAQADESARVTSRAAEALYAAGNTAKVDRDREQLFSAEITAERLGAEADLGPARERLNILMGLSGTTADAWTVAVRLPHAAAQALDSRSFEDRAVAASFSVRLANARLRAAAARRGVTNIESVLQDLEVSGEYERDDGVEEEGFGVSASLPIFGFGFPERLRGSAEFRQALQERQAAEIEVRANARAIVQRVEAARRHAVYRRETVLPLSAEVLQGAFLDFNAMQIGVFQLMEARRDRIRAGREYIDALRVYWSAQTDLDGLAASTGSGDAGGASAGSLPGSSNATGVSGAASSTDRTQTQADQSQPQNQTPAATSAGPPAGE